MPTHSRKNNIDLNAIAHSTLTIRTHRKSIKKCKSETKQAEQVLLAALMAFNESLTIVNSIITENSFNESAHQLVFRAIKQLSTMNNPCNAISVSDWLHSQNLLSVVGGEEYLSVVMQKSPENLIHIVEYAEKIRDLAVLRELTSISYDVIKLAYGSGETNAINTLDLAKRKFLEFFDQENQRMNQIIPTEINTILASVVENTEFLQRNCSQITGLATGFIELDHKTKGMQNGDLIIISACRNVGKSAFALNLIENVVFGTDLPVIVFSMNMPANLLTENLLSSFGSIEHSRLHYGRMEEIDRERLKNAMNQFSSKHLYIDDSSVLHPHELCSRARNIAQLHNGKIGAILVDYLQMMNVSGHGDDKSNEVSETLRQLKSLAQELNCPIIAVSALDSRIEKRINKRPNMWDLRAQGILEQDADLFMFVYKDALYNPKSNYPDVTEIIIGKQRNGLKGTVHLVHQPQFKRFVNPSLDYDLPLIED